MYQNFLPSLCDYSSVGSLLLLTHSLTLAGLKKIETLPWPHERWCWTCFIVWEKEWMFGKEVKICGFIGTHVLRHSKRDNRFEDLLILWTQILEENHDLSASHGGLAPPSAAFALKGVRSRRTSSSSSFSPSPSHLLFLKSARSHRGHERRQRRDFQRSNPCSAIRAGLSSNLFSSTSL